MGRLDKGYRVKQLYNLLKKLEKIDYFAITNYFQSLAIL